MPRILLFVTLIALVCALAPRLQAAETVHLYLKLGGVDVKGESTQKSLGRDNSIECLSYEQQVITPTRPDGMVSGAPVVQPIIFTKRIDKSSPLLLKAIQAGQIAEGEFRFFRPNPMGDGTTQQFYTVGFKRGRIISVRQFSPNTINPANSNNPPQEEVKIACGSITYIYTDGNVTSTLGAAETKGASSSTTGQDTGDAQPPTDDGQLNQVYALGKEKPLHFSLLRAEYTTAQVNIADLFNVPSAKEKLLVLHFSLQNPSDRETNVRFDSLDIKAFDEKKGTYPAVGRWGVEGMITTLDTTLLPTQKIEGYAILRLPAKDVLPRLRVAPREGSDPLGFDLRDKVAALPAPIADPADKSGATARFEVPGAVNAVYPYRRFSATLEKMEYTTSPLLDKTPPEGGRFLVCTLLAKNMSPAQAALRSDTFTARCFTGSGAEVKSGGTLLLATENLKVDQQMKPGAELRVRLYFIVTKEITPKTVTLSEGESREYHFSVAT